MAYTIKVKDGIFYKRWTNFTPGHKWTTKAKAKTALKKYVSRNKHLKPGYFKVTKFKVDRRFKK